MKVIFHDTINEKTFEREIDDKYLHMIEQWRKDNGCNLTRCIDCPFARMIPCEDKGFGRLSENGRYKISFQISMTLFD